MALTAQTVTPGTLGLWFSRERLGKPVHWPSDSGQTAPRYLVAPDGVFWELEDPPGARRRVKVAAVLGSGARGLTPISIEDGRKIRELRLSYSSAHQGWMMTPGTDGDPDPAGTPKSAEQSRDCLECHGTLLAWRENRLDLDSSVLGVHCERCHGPGSAHVRAALESSPDLRIFNPGSLRADQQVWFCGQCHRRPSDFEPLEVLARAPMLARHAGAGLMLSACYRRSPPEKTVTCLDCHDPHRNIDRDRDPFQKACLRCHSSPEREHWSQPVSASSNCVPCHMPVEEKGFHGVSFTDHWIRIPSSRAPLDSARQNDYLRYLEASYREAALRPGLGLERRARLLVNLAEVLYGRGDPVSAFQSLREGLSFSPTYRQRLRAAGMLRHEGRVEEAIEALDTAILAEPGLSEAYYEQAQLLQQQGKLEAAAARYRGALAARPDFAGAHSSLGSVLALQGHLEEAIASFRKALELKPDYAEAHQNLGLALRDTGQLDEGLAHFREAVRLKPDWPAPLNTLARILATHPDPVRRHPEEALRLADRAAELTRYAHPMILDTLAAAYAAAGRFEKAVAVAEEAVRLASAENRDKLAQEIRSRLELYRRKHPYQELPQP